MSALEETALEIQVAEALIDSLSPEAVEIRDRGTALELTLRKRGWKLGQVLLSKISLRRLATDRDGRVKLDYLRRDIERNAMNRRKYAFPRTLRFV